jgi:putative MFS transporter
MWFLNLPTGLILIALSGAIPESAKFLMSIGRIDAAQAIMKRFGSVVRERNETARGRRPSPRPDPAADRASLRRHDGRPQHRAQWPGAW